MEQTNKQTKQLHSLCFEPSCHLSIPTIAVGGKNSLYVEAEQNLPKIFFALMNSL